jgi:peroxiredoxin
MRNISINKKISFLFIFLVIIFTLSCKTAPKKNVENIPAVGDSPEQLKVGALIDDFTLPVMDTKDEISFKNDIKGKHKVTALYFYSSSCAACVRESKLLIDFTNNYSDDFYVYVVIDYLVRTDFFAYKNLFKSKNMKFLLDSDHVLLKSLGYSFTPSLVLFNKDGKILFMHTGYKKDKDPELIANAIKEALGAK